MILNNTPLPTSKYLAEYNCPSFVRNSYNKINDRKLRTFFNTRLNNKDYSIYDEDTLLLEPPSNKKYTKREIIILLSNIIDNGSLLKLLENNRRNDDYFLLTRLLKTNDIEFHKIAIYMIMSNIFYCSSFKITNHHKISLTR